MQSDLGGLEADLLGPPSFRYRGEKLKVPGGRPLALLCYLALTDALVTREKLLSLLWDEGEAANVDLRQVLQKLRALPGSESWLKTSDGSVRLRVATDVAAFEQALEDVRHEDAIALWRRSESSARQAEHLLWSLNPAKLSADYETLLEAERARLFMRYGEALQAYGAQMMMRGEAQKALELHRQALELDDLNETAHQAVMRLCFSLGNPQAALAQFETCRKAMLREFGVEPLPETLELYREIAQAVAEKRSLISERVKHLPVFPTSFIGRDRDIKAISGLLSDPGCRLLTLLGPGGIGKTRLATEAARHEAARFADGPQFVPLVGVAAPEQFAAAIAASLGLNLQGPGALEDKLLAFVADKALLLVLDNFEHLVSRAPLVAALLERSPNSKALVTSRERLNLQGEHLYDVSGMPYPASPDAEAFLGYDAVRLFWQTAQRVRPGFRLAEADYPHVLRICQWLEGMPIALEFTASWIQALSCKAIADELAKGNLDILSTNLKDVPERHRNIHAVFEKSWRMLAEDEKKILAELSVFRGGFTREAAREVTGASLRHLRALVDKTFIRPLGQDRYEMLAAIRQFLTGLPEYRKGHIEAKLRMIVFFVNQTATDKELKGLRSDADNLVAVLDYAQAHAKNYAEVVAPLFSWLDLRGLNALAKRHLEQVVETGTGSSDIAFVRCLAYLGGVERELGNAEGALNHLSRALELVGDKDASLKRQIIQNLGMCYLNLGNLDEARRHYEEALKLNLGKTEEERFGKGQSFMNIGGVDHHKGLVAKAIGSYEEALVLFRSIGNERYEGMVLCNLGLALQQQGDEEKAEAYYLESLTLLQRVGDRPREVNSLGNLGMLNYERGEYDKALSFFERALEISREIHRPASEQGFLDCIGAVYRKLGDVTKAIDLHKEALKINQEINHIYGEAYCLKNLGDAYRDLNEQVRAITLYLVAHDLFDKAGFHEREQVSKAFVSVYKQASKDLDVVEALAREGNAFLEALAGKPYPLFQESPTLAAKIRDVLEAGETETREQ